jgi:anthranilate phosphoribosyltransferase
MMNLLGPLANPAGAQYQLLGVCEAGLLDPLAGALAQLEIRQAYIVCGHDGLDEVSLSGPTVFRRVRSGAVTSGRWLPDEFGLAPVSLADVQADSPAASAGIIRAVLSGEQTPAARLAVANAAAAIFTAERADSLRHGVELGWQAIRSGRASRVLESMRLTRSD